MKPYLEEAHANLAKLTINPYPGRGIVVGMDETGKHLVQVYWIMGRSENSRNRVFKFDQSGRLWTAPADPSKVKDPSLIIYNAMVEDERRFVVSNGTQTDSITNAAKAGVNFYKTILTILYEPDAPNFTPRISAICSLELFPFIEISVLKRSRWGDGCDRHLYHYENFQPGIGWCVTTYMGDGDPLPAFEGDPYLLPLKGHPIDVGLDFRHALDGNNFVSLAVKFINIQSGESTTWVTNQYTEVANVPT